MHGYWDVVSDRVVGALFVVVSTPIFQALEEIGKAHKPIGVQPAHLAGQQTAIYLLPAAVGCLAASGLAAELRDWRALLALLQHKGRSRLREHRCLHAFPLLAQLGKTGRNLQLQTIQSSEGRAYPVVTKFFLQQTIGRKWPPDIAYS